VMDESTWADTHQRQQLARADVPVK
jgi:hypothetical protein